MRTLTQWIAMCSLVFCSCWNEEVAASKAVFILVDGIPADVVESVRTPSLDAISADGGYTRAFVGGAKGGVTESPTVSAVSYNSLLTGTWANKHNVWGNDIEDPDYTYWDIFRIARAADPSLSTALFSTLTDNRTKLLGEGLAAAGGSKLDHVVDELELDVERFPKDDESRYIREIDTVVASEAASYLLESGPDLTWIYLQYSDDIGHLYGDGPELEDAVRFMDRRVGLVWEAVRERAQRTGEDWLIVVTTDHGRDAQTGKGHGGQTDRERTIWIATNSERLNPRFANRPGIVDILPSIAAHLGLRIPDAVAERLDGESFID